MTKFFTIDRLKQAIEHLQVFDSKWVLVPLVFAVNGVTTDAPVRPTAAGKAGTDAFFDQYFHGSLIGLPELPSGNAIRPRFSDVKAGVNYIAHQSIKVWGTQYSSRGYREMEGYVEKSGSSSATTYRLRPSFWEKWQQELPENFNFEELLVWLYGFTGFNDEINSWEELFILFQEQHLGQGGRFPAGYSVRFNVDKDVPFPLDLNTTRPSDEEYRQALLPSVFTAPGESRTFVELADEFSQAVFNAGVRFGDTHQEFIHRFISSLATKPFVLLTGLSGSGKTQVALKFGEWLGPTNYLVVPVRPDWTGGEALFGYENALDYSTSRPSWFVPPVLEFVLRAQANPRDPHVLILDEMNLAHVERYFGDFLSGIESRKPIIPNLEIGPDMKWRIRDNVPRLIPIPRNLFVIGTVNVDETTYMFSPKVLDRANTIEFRVETNDLVYDLQRPSVCTPGNQGFTRTLLEITVNDSWQVQHLPQEIDLFAEKLRELHEILLEGGYEFGHRVFYEACRYFAFYAAAGHSTWQETLDVQILQKILPRLHGSQRRLGPTLRTVGAFCHNPNHKLNLNLGSNFDPSLNTVNDAVLSRSYAKIKRMYRNLMANQYTSFTE